MIFIINKLKYDTENMELVSTKCKHYYTSLLIAPIRHTGKNVKLFKSKKGNWLLTYETDYQNCAIALSEEKAQEYLLQYDYTAYEKYFGTLEEA